MTNVVESLDRFTYRDYKKWDEGIRYELIYGEAYMMSSPDVWHQDMVLEIGSRLKQFLNGKRCKPFIAPFDVRLFPRSDESDDVVVQPDVLVVCDESKISDGKACKGAPDFIVEVVSPGSKMTDLSVKKDLYFKAGVREYWIVGRKKIYTYVSVDAAYAETVYNTGFSDILEIPVSVLPGCVLKLSP